MQDFDDLSIVNVIRERREADADARHDAAEFYRFVYGENRSDDALCAALFAGERTPETVAAYERRLAREPSLTFPHKTVEERERESEEQDRKSSEHLRAWLAADPEYQAIRRGK